MRGLIATSFPCPRPLFSPSGNPKVLYKGGWAVIPLSQMGKLRHRLGHPPCSLPRSYPGLWHHLEQPRAAGPGLLRTGRARCMCPSTTWQSGWVYNWCLHLRFPQGEAPGRSQPTHRHTCTGIQAHMYAHTYTCLYIYTRVHIHAQTHAHAHMHTHIQVHMDVHTCT